MAEPPAANCCAEAGSRSQRSPSDTSGGGGGALPCVRVSPACDAPAPSCNDGSQHSLLSRVMRNILWIMWLMLSCSHSSRCERKERLISATE